MYLNFDIGVTLRWQLYINALLIVFVFVDWFFCPDSFTSTLCRRRRQKLKSLCNISNSSFLFCPTGSHLLKLGEFYHISSSQTEDMLGKSKKMATLHQTGFTIKIMNHVPIFLKTHLVGFFGCSQIYWPGHHPKWPHLLFLFFFFWFLCGILCRFFCAILCLTNILAWPPPQMTPPDGVLVQMRCNIYHIMGHTLTTKYCFYSKGSSQLKKCVLWRQISQTNGGI